MNSALTGALFRKQLMPASLSNAASPRIPLSASGRPFVKKGIELCLSDCPKDRIPILQLFAQQYPTGALAPGCRTVRFRTVEDALRSVGQAFAGLEAPDPCLNQYGDIDFCLTSLLNAWKKADAPPARIKPLPLHLVYAAVCLAWEVSTALALSAADCLVVGFYFLLCPCQILG
jgi:hypothetical protein